MSEKKMSAKNAFLILRQDQVIALFTQEEDANAYLEKRPDCHLITTYCQVKAKPLDYGMYELSFENRPL